MHSAQDFRLVLCADVSSSVVQRALKILGRTVEAEMARDQLDGFPKSLIISYFVLITKMTMWAVAASVL